MDQKILIELINSIKSSNNRPDVDAERLLFAAYLPQIEFKIRHRLNNAANIGEDLIQDVAIQLIQSLRKGNFDPAKSKLSSYINGIVNHVIIKYFANKKDGQTIEIDENIINYLLNIPRYGEAIDLEKLRKCLRDNLKKLPANYQEVYLLFYQDELSTKEIARKLGRPATTISNEKFQATRSMKKKCFSQFFSQ